MNRSKTFNYLLGLGILILSLTPETLRSQQSLVCSSPDFQVTLSATDCTAEISPGDAITPGSTTLPGYPDAFTVDLYYDMAKTMPVPTSPSVTASEIGVTVWVEVTYNPPNGDPATTCWTSTDAVEDKTDPVIECPCGETDSYSSSLLGDDGPRYVRPDGDGIICSENVGINTHAYDAFVFSIETAGVYNFTMDEVAVFNSYGFIYQGDFDPDNPCDNFLIGNADDGPGNESAIQFTADPGVYTLVTTHNGEGPKEYDFTWNFEGPGAVLEGDCVYSCTQLDSLLDGSIAGPLPVITEACSEVDTTIVDLFINGPCELGPDTLRRKVYATDESLNVDSCTYDILILKPSGDDVEFPEEEILECSSASPPSTDPSNTGYPQVDGLDITGVTNDCGLFSTYSDAVTDPFMCPNQVLIMRQWSVKRSCDWMEIASGMQIIKIMDTAAPVFDNCPTEAIEVNASSEDCTGSEFLPVVTATDACGTVTLSTEVSNGTLFNNDEAVFGLPLGDTEVTVTAEDECGNSDECIYTITAVDLTPPVVVCETFHTVGVIGDPTLVNASVFDDGSEDYCSDVTFLARRMEGDSCDFIDETAFAETVPFFCCDVGDTIMVQLIVTDESNNSNSCMVSVEVQDKLNPIIQCPIDKAIECEADTSSASNGTATAIDNCEIASIFSVDVLAYEGCYPDTIFRTWTALDVNGRTASCLQTIEIINSEPFDITTDVICPPNLVDPGVDCTASTDPADTGEPMLMRDDCDNLGMTAAMDVIIYPENNALDDFLFKIERTWIIKDWCDPDENGQPASRTCVQFIKVIDTDDPSFTCPTDLTVNTGDPTSIMIVDITDNCTAFDDLDIEVKINGTVVPGLSDLNVLTGPGTDFPDGINTVMITIGDQQLNELVCMFDVEVDDDPNSGLNCSSFINADTLYTVGISDGGVGILESDTSVLFENGIVPLNPMISLTENGTFSTSLGFDCGDLDEFKADTIDLFIKFDVGGGNTLTCQTEVEIKDVLNPSVACNSNLGVTFTTDVQSFTFTKDFLVLSSGDQCTPDDQLAYSFVPPSVSVADLTLTQPVPVLVLVEDLQGNGGFCPATVTLSMASNVAGIIENEEGVEVEHVHIEASGAGMLEEAMTTETGDFSFDLPMNDNYVITPDRNDDPLNGVSTLDLIKINQHILQVEALNSPYKIIAADINRSGEVTTFDLVNLRKLILYIDTEFTNNNSWRFVDAGFVFPDPANPFLTDFPEVYTINGLTEDMQTDFVAIKVGDVNCSASANDLVGGGDDRNAGTPVLFQVEDLALKAGESYKIDFTLAEVAQLQGYQFSLHFDQNALAFEAVEAGDLAEMTEGNFGLQLLDRGVVTASWHTNDVIDVDKVTAFSMRFTARTDIALSEVLSMSSAYTKAEAYTATDIASVDLAFETETGLVTKQFQLFQNRPNPFKGETVISFQLPEAEAGVLKIYDLTGRVVKTIESEFTAGYNEVALSSTELAGHGVYFYQLDVANYSAMRKMIVLQ